MTPKEKEITRADLLELENKINDKQQTARHGQNNLIQEVLLKSSNNETDNKLLKQSVETMNKDIQELKKDTKEGIDEIKDLIKGLDEKYAKKETLTGIIKVLWIIGTAVIIGIVTAILKAIGPYLGS